MFARLNSLGLALFLASPGVARATDEFIAFPKDFRWCVSSSATQIEGNSDNDWTANEAGHVLDDQRTGLAVDHMHHQEEDNDLTKDLGVRESRISIDWARLEPQPGVISPEGLAYYQREIKLMRARGIAPQVTLQHFTLPNWVRAKGGFEWDKFPEQFAAFAKLAYDSLYDPEAGGVRTWYTFNEPMVYLSGSYITGDFPPFEKRALSDLTKPAVGLLRAHAAAYAALHAAAEAKAQTVEVGIAQHVRDFRPANGLNIADRIAASAADNAWNWSLLDALETGHLSMHIPLAMNVEAEVPGLKNTQDFIGINYYSGDKLSLKVFRGAIALQQLNRQGKTDLGWDVDPKGMIRTLVDAQKRYPDKTIFISETGVADSRQYLGAKFLRDDFYAVKEAIKQGVRVKGLCIWSLTDNYEWREGMHAKFGLYGVDLGTFKRTLRPMGEFYRDVIAHNGFTMDPKQFGKVPPPPEPLKHPVVGVQWSARARVYSNGSGCRIVFDPTTDAQGNGLTSVYVVNRKFETNPTEGVIRIRDKDHMIVGGPEECHNQFVSYLQSTLDPDDEGARRFTLECGSPYDHMSVQMSFGSSDENWQGADTIPHFNYRQSVRENSGVRNLTHFAAGRTETAARKMLADFSCNDLKLESPGASPAAASDDSTPHSAH